MTQSYAFAVGCDCRCPNQPFMPVTDCSLEEWRKVVQRRKMFAIKCPACGCLYDLVDHVTSIGQKNVSQPRIDYIASLSTGPVAGGTPVTIRGHVLDFGNVVVRFDGVPGVNVRRQNDGSLTVDTPAHAAGTVSVSVENENGMRAEGGTLVGAFTFVP